MSHPQNKVRKAVDVEYYGMNNESQRIHRMHVGLCPHRIACLVMGNRVFTDRSAKRPLYRLSAPNDPMPQ